jgi:starch synthase
MHVLFVSTEVAPYSSSGALGELSGALPGALRAKGVSVTVVTPFYGDIAAERFGLARRLTKVEVPVGDDTVEISLVEGKHINSDVSVIFVDHEESFGREGHYAGPDGPFSDNHRRFYLLSRGALAIAEALGIEADLVHANGWQTGLLPLLLKQGVAPTLQKAPVLFTLHDTAMGGLFEPAILDELGLGREHFTPEGIEFHNKVSLLKAGVIFADHVSTLSPTYAREIQSPAFGGGFEGLMAAQQAKLTGIVPGIDPTAWNPARDHRLEAAFTDEDLAGKSACKRALQAELGLQARPELPLALVLGPLDPAFGDDLLLEALGSLTAQKLQLGLVGTGGLAERVRSALPESGEATSAVAVRDELDPELTHRALAGADVVLSLHRTAPGGDSLHLKAQRYGAVPVVCGVGGYRDTVIDFDAKTRTGNGVSFSEPEGKALLGALNRVVALYRDQETWQALAQNAMRAQHTVARAAGQHLEIYQSMLV